MAESERTWFDITLEEEEERDKQERSSGSSSIPFLSDGPKRSFPVLSPLKEADRALEIKEELSINQHVDIDGEFFEECEPAAPVDKNRALFTTPKRTRLGPRALQRHSMSDELDGMTMDPAEFSPETSPHHNLTDVAIDGIPMESADNSQASQRQHMASAVDGLSEEPIGYSPVTRRVRVTMVEASPSSMGNSDPAPLSGNVKSRLGPRASNRHSTTPQQTGSKRHIARDSPRRDTDHKEKRFRVGTPTRDKHTPTRNDKHTPSKNGKQTPTRNNKSTPIRNSTTRSTPNHAQDDYSPIRNDVHAFSTPEPVKKPRNKTDKFKTPNSDSRVYAKKSNNRNGEGKDLFGRGGSRGTSECEKENEPSKELTEEQIAKREKQVLYGKVTEGYQNYKAVIPKNLRNIRDAATPKKDYPYSKRCWDGLIRSWRRKLHDWDDPKRGLDLRAVYTKNNRDLKENGLITETGEVVCCLTQENDTKQPHEDQEISTASESFVETDHSSTRQTEPRQYESGNWDIPDFVDPEDENDDDRRSVDSEYTRLLGNQDDFPEDDESDHSYHLSQDRHLEEYDFEDEMMICEDEDIVGMTVQTSDIAV